MTFFVNLILFICSVGLAIGADFENNSSPDKFELSNKTDSNFQPLNATVNSHDNRRDEMLRERISESKPASSEQTPIGQNLPSTDTRSLSHRSSQPIAPVLTWQDSIHALGYEAYPAMQANNRGESDLGFHDSNQADTPPYSNNSLYQLHDEVRVLVGEEVYEKLVWTYFDLKNLDNWIYSTMNQYFLNGVETFEAPHDDLSLDIKLKANLLGINDSVSQALHQSRQQQLDSLDEVQKNLLADNQLQVANDLPLKSNKLSIFMELLTIKNLLYLLLSVLCLGLFITGFKFLVRQER